VKLLVFSDLHEESQALEKLRAFAEREKPDIVLSCGDMARSVSFAEETMGSFKNFYFVPGNWDSKAANDYYSKLKGYIHKKRVEVGGLNIVGFGFSPITPFHTFGEKNEEEIEKEMAQLAIDKDTLLLLHAPPNGFFDNVGKEHVGSRAIRRIVEKKSPFMVLFGHVHETIGFCKRGNTFFVKVPPAQRHKCALVSINNKNPSVEFIHL